MKIQTNNDDVVVMSDLHLGNPSCKRKDIWDVLRSKFKLLIINGDLIDCKYALGSQEIAIIKRLERLQAEGRLICIRGNHEEWNRNNHLNNLDLRDDYTWCPENIKFYFTHGHKFLHMWESSMKVEKAAFQYAKKNNIRVICTGHDHWSGVVNDKKLGIIYCNAGSMLGFNNQVVVITPDLYIRLEDVNFKEIKSFKTLGIPFTGFNGTGFTDLNSSSFNRLGFKNKEDYENWWEHYEKKKAEISQEEREPACWL